VDEDGYEEEFGNAQFEEFPRRSLSEICENYKICVESIFNNEYKYNNSKLNNSNELLNSEHHQQPNTQTTL
jgi:hypothetical protein